MSEYNDIFSKFNFLQWSKTYLDDQNNLVDVSEFISLIWDIDEKDYSSDVTARLDEDFQKIVSGDEKDKLIDSYLMQLEKFKAIGIERLSNAIKKSLNKNIFMLNSRKDEISGFISNLEYDLED
jgi:hypothetical protein